MQLEHTTKSQFIEEIKNKNYDELDKVFESGFLKSDITELMSDKQFIIMAFSHNDKIFDYISKDLKSDLEFLEDLSSYGTNELLEDCIFEEKASQMIREEDEKYAEIAGMCNVDLALELQDRRYEALNGADIRAFLKEDNLNDIDDLFTNQQITSTKQFLVELSSNGNIEQLILDNKDNQVVKDFLSDNDLMLLGLKYNHELVNHLNENMKLNEEFLNNAIAVLNKSNDGMFDDEEIVKSIEILNKLKTEYIPAMRLQESIERAKNAVFTVEDLIKAAKDYDMEGKLEITQIFTDECLKNPTFIKAYEEYKVNVIENDLKKAMDEIEIKELFGGNQEIKIKRSEDDISDLIYTSATIKDYDDNIEYEDVDIDNVEEIESELQKLLGE
ncbi:hypothetical protein CDEF62S_06392 [Castellaniella defragrans]